MQQLRKLLSSQGGHREKAYTGKLLLNVQKSEQIRKAGMTWGKNHGRNSTLHNVFFQKKKKNGVKSGVGGWHSTTVGKTIYLPRAR